MYDPSRERDYAELKRRVVAAGLLDKQLRYYALNTVIRFAILAASISILFIVDNIWVQLANAVLLAVAFTQIGFLGHDAGHRQIFAGAAKNNQFGLVLNLLLGISRSWWIDTHNEHHVNPNDLEKDPHTMLPVFAFSEEQAQEKKGWLRRAVGYQAYYFYPVFLLQGLGVKMASVMYLMKPGGKDRALEASLMALHFVVYFGVLFYVFSVWQAIAFITVHQVFFGLYMGLTFAPNHKGMPTIDDKSGLDFLRKQVLTSRNISGSAVTDFVYGGLNYQIEHHLFPSMPRNQLGKAQVIVRQFCDERSIPYRESGATESHREIVSFLHEIGAPLRAERS